MKKRFKTISLIVAIAALLLIVATSFIAGYYVDEYRSQRVRQDEPTVGGLLLKAQGRAIDKCKASGIHNDICNELQLYDMTSYQNDFEKDLRYVFYFSNSNSKSDSTAVFSVAILANGDIVDVSKEAISHLDNGRPAK